MRVDHKVKIWNTLPIVDVDADNDNNPKLLCSMSTHTGELDRCRHVEGQKR